MEKIRKKLLSIIIFFVFILNNFNFTYAVDVDINEEQDVSNGTIKMLGLIILTIILITIVFYFAYKMDEKDEKNKKRQNRYYNGIEFKKNHEDTQVVEEFENEEEENQVIDEESLFRNSNEDFLENHVNNKKVTSKEELVEQEKIKENSKEEIEEKIVIKESLTKPIENIASNEEESDEDIDNLYNFKSNLKIYKNVVDTSLFDTDNIKKDIAKKVNDEFDQDSDLNDIMGLLKEANIRKFTKKVDKKDNKNQNLKKHRVYTKKKLEKNIIDKKLEELLKNKNRPEKIYSRKKKKKVELPKKVFTRKKVKNLDIEDNQEKIVLSQNENKSEIIKKDVNQVTNTSDILFNEMIENKTKEAKSIVEEEFSKLTNKFTESYNYEEEPLEEKIEEDPNKIVLPKRRRGRPTKEEQAARKALEASIPKKRGRPKKVEPKRRGRPIKNTNK